MGVCLAAPFVFSLLWCCNPLYHLKTNNPPLEVARKDLFGGSSACSCYQILVHKRCTPGTFVTTRNCDSEETDGRRADLPRHLRLTMNRQGFKGQYMAARGRITGRSGGRVGRVIIGDHSSDEMLVMGLLRVPLESWANWAGLFSNLLLWTTASKAFQRLSLPALAFDFCVQRCSEALHKLHSSFC